MRIVSWNVNGLRAILKKSFLDDLSLLNPDIMCLQEIKCLENQIDVNFDGYYAYFNSATRKGYSGTLVLTKELPLNVTYGLDGEFLDEGRVITCEYDSFFLVCVYSPNSQDELKRLSYRMEYEEALRGYLVSLKMIKPVILCGDLNVAHEEIDLTNPETNHFNPGFSDEEREAFTKLLNAGFIDTYRFLHPDEVKFSWWSYRFNARENNVGWRIDYFVTSSGFISNIDHSEILNEFYGSDHCPVLIEFHL